MTIKKNGGIFGRNPTFNDVDVDGTLSVGGTALPTPSNIAKLDTAQEFTQEQEIKVSDITAYDATAADAQVTVGPTLFLNNPTNNNTTVGGQVVFGLRSTPYYARLGATGGSIPKIFVGIGTSEIARFASDAITFNAIQTNTAHPAFRANITSTVNNVTGDNTTYNTNAAIWTEIYDQNSDFSDGTFTAPVTGKYHFDIVLSLTGVSSANHLNSTITLTASNRSTTFYKSPGADYNNSLGGVTYSLSIDVDMDAADTAYWRVNVAGGSKTIDIFSTTVTSGHLIC